MLMPGNTIGQYRIDQVLGEGAMGVVYKAFDTVHDRTVALKALSSDLAESEDYRMRLQTEAELNAAVDSPYVVKVWEHGQFNGQPFIAMEYVSGDELRDAAGRLSFEDKIDMFLKLGEGLAAAHTRGLVHRDLKPENIKVSADGIPKILDFGLAKTVETDQVDEHGDIEGTLYYLSPEQLSGDPPTPSSDIFSYGTILYETVVGRRPFEGDFSASVIYAILHEDPDPPTEVNEQLPRWLDVLTAKLLAKRPEDRYETITGAIEFLRKCAEVGEAAVEEWIRPTRTVTVIDLRNRSGDESWNYFCEGFTDDVIRELSRRTDLVVSAEPATAYSRDIKETFDKCRSDFVVAGSLMKWQEQLRLDLSIYGDHGAEVLWSETFTDHTQRLFDILSNAAKKASDRLAEVTESEAVGVEREVRYDVSAYDAYLKGKSYYQTNKPDDLERAEQQFRQALEIDPEFALAYTGLADLYAFQYMAYYDRTPARISMARDHALKAIEIDSQLPEAQRSLARYYMFTGQTEQAENSLLAAINLNPKYAIAYRTLGWLKQTVGDYAAATRWARKSLELAPTDLETLLLLGFISLSEHKLTAAIATLERAIELGPDYGRAYFYLGQAYFKLGALGKAQENFEQAAKYKGDPNCWIESGYVCLVQNDYANARERFKRSVESGYFPFVATYHLGFTERLAGNDEEAREYFKTSLSQMREHDLTRPENFQILPFYALALAGLGREDDARIALGEIEASPDLDALQQYIAARAYALLNDAEKARELLDQCTGKAGGPTAKEIKLDPHFSHLAQ